MQRHCTSYPCCPIYHKEELNSALSEETPTVEGALEKTIFFPALWNQRLSSVTNLLGHFGVRKVLDLGCGEGKLATYLKHNENIEEVRGIDLEENTLFLAASLAYPLVGDYLFPRSSPLTVSFFKGDLLTPHPSLLGFDSAVCIEVIEHLEKEKLKRLEKVVFEYVRPRLVIFSTPNFEFNVVFRDTLSSQFRHYDHKFEFTRSQFREWGEGVKKEYGYEVEYCGVGDPPEEYNDVGHCSQFAVFFNPSSSFPFFTDPLHDHNNDNDYNNNDNDNDNNYNTDDHLLDHHLIKRDEEEREKGRINEKERDDVMGINTNGHGERREERGGIEWRGEREGEGKYEKIAEIKYPIKKKEIREEQVHWELEHYYRMHCEMNDWPLNHPVEITTILSYPSPLLSQCFNGDVDKAASSFLSSPHFLLSSDRSHVFGSPSYYFFSLHSRHDDDDDLSDDDYYYHNPTDIHLTTNNIDNNYDNIDNINTTIDIYNDNINNPDNIDNNADKNIIDGKSNNNDDHDKEELMNEREIEIINNNNNN